MNNKLCFIHFFEIVGILSTRLLENEILSSNNQVSWKLPSFKLMKHNNVSIFIVDFGNSMNLST
jgi:hypothetical protein